MINKELELNVNNERILNKLAENLNLDFISDSSNIKKMADIYSSDNLTFSTSVDDALKNAFLMTMNEDFLNRIGSIYNIYRRKYSNIKIDKNDQTITITPVLEEVLVSNLTSSLSPFKKGDILYSDENFIIELSENVVIIDLVNSVPISVRITSTLGTNSYVIPANTTFGIYPTDTENSKLFIPKYNLQVTQSIGIATVEESLEDYRLRLLEATYLASNGANSALSSLTKEVPLIKYIEIQDYSIGRSIKTIYPYTQELIDIGTDPLIKSFLIPLLQSNLESKILHNNGSIDIVEPSPILFNVYLNFDSNINKPTTSYFNNVRLSFNQFFNKRKTNINRETIVNYLIDQLPNYELIDEMFTLEFSSPYVSEEVYSLDTDEVINIPEGRFLHLNLIQGIDSSNIEVS